MTKPVKEISPTQQPPRPDRLEDGKQRFEIDASESTRAPKFVKKDGELKLKDDGDPVEEIYRLAATFGSGDSDFIQCQTNLLAKVSDENSVSLSASLAFVHAMDAKDIIEGALATQMAATHYFALRCLATAGRSENPDLIEMKINQANKLMRTFAVQMEALNRNRGKGQQKVTVEHVTINSGGQAIVGHVSPGGMKP